MKMQAGKITAKLRDAVPVRFMTKGEEVKSYKNIDIPDSLKELEINDFQFDIAPDGKISFQLFFEEGILPEVFPESRAKLTRKEKEETKADPKPETEESPIPEVIVNINTPISAEEEKPAAPDIMEINYNIKGERRKELVTALEEIIGWKAVYKAAPSFVFVIKDYTIDKNGKLTGEKNQDLIEVLATRGFELAE